MGELYIDDERELIEDIDIYLQGNLITCFIWVVIIVVWVWLCPLKEET